MKKTLLLLGVIFMAFSTTAQSVITVSGDITTSTTWTSNNVYKLSGFVYVTNNAELTIQPGTVIIGEKSSKGSLIITRGAKIIADGTAAQPIVFTSGEPVGQRTYGDWGGLIILGRSAVNDPAGEKLIEGGVDPVKGLYGGTVPNDNSGVLRYVRIEFPGIAFQPNNEINGLTLGGVGSGTTIDYVQVSYSGDDSYECFGGTVNMKHLIAYRGLDDDFDTDFGYSGCMQFLVSVRDSSIADISGSNAFESDNDASGTTNTPFTNAKISNATIVGPITGSGNTYNSNYKRGAHIRRSSKTCIYNSAIAGFPTGLLLDGANCEANANSGDLQFRNSVFAGCNTPLAIASGSAFDISTWFNTASFGNSILSAATDLQLTNPYNYNQPDLLPQPATSLLNGADFNNSNLSNPFFDVVSYRGAFGSNDWTGGWSNYNCANTYYVGMDEIVREGSISIFPQPASSIASIRFDARTSGRVSISLLDLQGRNLSIIADKQFESGFQTVNFSTVELSAGLYLLRMESEKGQAAFRFIKN
ncbi:MAG: T9SS type A sorting domain-containing protein [Bacteroidota bacterium]